MFKRYLTALSIALFGIGLANPTFADGDAAAEARYQAERRAAHEAAAKRQAEQAARRAAAEAETQKTLADNYRRMYGKRTAGMTDAQIMAAAPQWDLERARQATQQVAEAIKSLPPEQRAMAEQAMKQAAAQKK